MKARQGLMGVGLALFVCLCTTGCGNKFFDPAQIGRFRPTPAVNVILESLGVAEETPDAWVDAEEPRPSDLVALEGDYLLNAGDVVRIAVFELLLEGQMVTNDYMIKETGSLSIPEVGVVQAAGISETQLEDRIRDILAPDILPNPTVQVTLINSQLRQCSVVGDGVARPNRFFIPRNNFRLTDALALAGGAAQFNVDHIFVARAVDYEQSTPSASPGTPANMGWGGGLSTLEPTIPETPMAEFGSLKPSFVAKRQAAPSIQHERQMLGMTTRTTTKLWAQSEKLLGRSQLRSPVAPQEIISPAQFPAATPYPAKPYTGYPSQRPTPQGFTYRATPTPQGTEAAPEIEWIFENGKWTPRPRYPYATPAMPAAPVPQTTRPTPPPVAAPQPTTTAPAPRVEWVFKDGQFVPIPAKPTTAGGSRDAAYEFGQDPGVLPLADNRTQMQENGWEESIQSRLLRIPKDKLMAGDPRYNVIIRPGDSIFVPVNVVGEFYIMGNVNRSGTINMTGRPMTLKMAIAAAGGLGPLAFPKNCEIVRRIDDKREEIVMVDLDKIASGEQPDFFVKPHDLINVGTHYSSRWRAVLRNSFRAAWGFGLVYDRNFADSAFGSGFPSWLPF
ncbi:polysaccharide biosynthesis/export family protein [Planctomycetota bacterium]